jgi:hypothetical protein
LAGNRAAVVQPSESLDNAASKTEEKFAAPAPTDEIKRLAVAISDLLDNETLGSKIKVAIINAFGNEDDTSFFCHADLGSPEYNEKWLRHFAGRFYDGEAHLAFQILNILGNEFLPFPIRNGIEKGLADIGQDFNSKADKTESFQYIADYLRYYNAEETDAPKREASNDGDEIQRLANQISELMHNPLLPEKIYNVLTDEFASIPEGLTDTPENILFNLKQMLNKQFPDE